MNHECAPQRMAGGYESFPLYKWKSGPDGFEIILWTQQMDSFILFIWQPLISLSFSKLVSKMSKIKF